MREIIIISVLGLLFLVSCRPESYSVDFSAIIDSYELDIYEPSGLSYSEDKQSLFTVSDRGMVYEISFTGERLRELPFTGDDLEGITVDPRNSDIYVCEERSGNLVKLNSNGVFQDSNNILQNAGNNGLEGLTYNESLDEYYLLKEKSEGLLIKYSGSGLSTSEIKLSFAYDYSGIFYNSASNKLWIVSDESRTLTQCNLAGVKLKSYELPIASMEGVVVNNEETEAYIVSDNNNKLYRVSLK